VQRFWHLLAIEIAEGKLVLEPDAVADQFRRTALALIEILHLLQQLPPATHLI